MKFAPAHAILNASRLRKTAGLDAGDPAIVWFATRLRAVNGLVRDTLCILMKEPCIGTSDSQASSTMDVQEQRLQKSCRNLVPVTVGFFADTTPRSFAAQRIPSCADNNYNCLLGASMTFSVATSEQYEKNRIAFLAASSRSRAVVRWTPHGVSASSAAQKQQQRQQEDQSSTLTARVP